MIDAKKLDLNRDLILHPWKFQGLGIESEVQLNIFQKGVRPFKLNRTRYEIFSSDTYLYDFKNSRIFLPCLKDEEFHLELKLVSDGSEERFLLKSLRKMKPFKINGAWVFESYLNKGDLIEIGLNKIKCLVSPPHGNSSDESIKINDQIARSKLPILIVGETGVGKTSLAKKIHDQSGLNGPFVHINLSSFSPSIIESELFGHIKGSFTGAMNDRKGCIMTANQGTLFIDEIDSVGKEIQTKLLLFLDSKKFKPVGSEIELYSDCRLIFSSGTSLENLVKNHSMRKDFYYRLHSGEKVTLPNLRENKQLIKKFIDDFEKKNGVFLDESLREYYQTLPWPGNYREIESHFEKKMIKEKSAKWQISEDDREKKNYLINDFQEHDDEWLSLEEYKESYIRKIFFKFNENIQMTAKAIKVSPNTIRAVVYKKNSGSDNVVEVDF